MLALNDFIPAVRASIPRFGLRPGTPQAPDVQQEACILHPAADPLQIVAGPGSGKTTVLVLRALRLVLVDGLLPEQIVLTTFTRKAADEIRTRLIEWGFLLVDHLRRSSGASLASFLANIDVNRFVTGTLDSICEDAVRTMRSATDAAPIVLESFAANALMHRKGVTGPVYSGGIVPTVASYLQRFTFDGEPPFNVAELTGVVRPLFDRFAHDLVDLPRYQQIKPHAKARAALRLAYEAYAQHLRTTNRLDFALLERLFLDRLVAGRLSRFVSGVKALLVDEYQDTNLLQESIYFTIAAQSAASLTVVGDDDQSLYRFRGATVELFRDFRVRLASALPKARVHRLDLVNNYRSTPEIVTFFNAFIANDSGFTPARVQNPPKPAIIHQLPSNGARVLGMFRSDAPTLAEDLAEFIHRVFRGPGVVVPGVAGAPVTIAKAQNGGDVGDAVLLGHSVNEYASSFMGQPPRERLPLLLRRELAVRGISTFNPRGQALRDIPDVQQLIGAMLECVDPNGAIAGSMNPPLRTAAAQQLAAFRAAYARYIKTNPRPTRPHGLASFVAAWGKRKAQSKQPWPREWPLLELCFTLLAWFPRLRDDPEGQVHLEGIARAVAQSATFSPYRSLILTGSAPHDRRSVEAVLRDVFGPLGEGSIDVDEDIMPSVPRDRFQMMTIHQAKGLEFPLVIVDVSSDYKTNHPKNRFKRFPDDASNVTVMEDDLSGACSVGPLRRSRTALDRTFDDLVRLFYVAYSRPQSLLVLVGLDASLQYRTTIKNVGAFWRRDGSWAWTGSYSSKKPPALANAINLELI